MASEGTLSAEAEAVRAKINRDINCLSDPDRAKRRGGINALKRRFDKRSREPVPPAVAAELYRGCLQTPLLKAFSDDVEGIREGAIGLVTFFCTSIVPPDQLPAVAAYVLPTLAARFTPLPFPEPAEELRLQLLQLLRVFVASKACIGAAGGPSALRDHIGDISEALAKASTDAFPDAKKEAADILVLLAAAGPAAAELHKSLEPLVKAQTANLGHQHSKVRSAALLALGALLPCASEGLGKLMRDTVLPAVKKMKQDRTASVRKLVLSVQRRWVTQLPDVSSFEAALVEGVLAGLVDESPAIQEAALAEVELMGREAAEHAAAREAAGAGAAGGAGGGGDAGGAGGDGAGGAPTSDAAMAGDDGGAGDPGAAAYAGGDDFMPAPFKGRPGEPARRLVRRLLPDLLASTLVDLTDWTVPMRVLAAGTLRSVVALAEEGVTTHLEALLAALCKGCADEEAAVAATVADAARLVGRFVDPAAQLTVLLPQVRGEVAGLTSGHHRAATLSVLAAAVDGMTATQLQPHLPALARSLVDPNLCEPEPLTLRRQLARVIGHVLDTAGPLVATTAGEAGAEPVSLSLLRALLLVQAAGGDEELGEHAVGMIAALAMHCGFHAYGSIIAAHAAALLDSCTVDVEFWDKTSPNCGFFDVLLRRGGAALGAHVPKIVAVFTVAMAPAKSAELRVKMLALINTFVGDDCATGLLEDEALPAAGASAEGDAERALWGDLQAALSANAEKLLMEVLLPNMVWRVGRIASTIRKVSLACTHTMLRRGIVPREAMRATLATLLPLFKSTLGDDEWQTRHASLLVLEGLFSILSGELNDDHVRELYPELVKRLDDSNDTVRLAVCSTYHAFAGCAPEAAFRGAPFEYTVDCLFVHLDDPSREVQTAVLGAIKAFAHVKPAYVVKQAADARTKHRSPVWCDEVTEFARGLEAGGAAAAGGAGGAGAST